MRESRVGTFSVIVEEGKLERVTCEIRDGEAFFIFRIDASPNRQVAIHADDYLALLEEIRESAVQRTFTRVRFNADVHSPEASTP